MSSAPTCVHTHMHMSTHVYTHTHTLLYTHTEKQVRAGGVAGAGFFFLECMIAGPRPQKRKREKRVCPRYQVCEPHALERDYIQAVSLLLIIRSLCISAGLPSSGAVTR